MSNVKPTPSQAYLDFTFTYDAHTGLLNWSEEAMTPWKNNPVGSRGACGHLKLKLDGRSIYVHRVIWKLVTGEDPDKCIDHINGDPSDNRWCNLRLATPSENTCNSKLSRRNSSGFKGVTPAATKGKWQANLQFEKNRVYLGTYDTPQEAHVIYRIAAARMHGEFSRDFYVSE